MSTAGMGNPTPVIGIKRYLPSTPRDANAEDYLSRMADAVEEALTSSPYDTGWLSISSFSNSWASSTARYRRIGRIVYLDGAIGSGSTGIAFNLPAGFRPSTQSFFLVQASSSTTVASSTLVTVGNNGDVTAISGAAPRLSAISFPVA